jgi:uncharacterized protein (UPF0261 family)
VADILGLNSVTRRVLAEGAGAVCGMMEIGLPNLATNRPSIGVTTAGVTTPCATAIRERLEKAGFEAVAFHCNGIGGQAMEELVTEGRIAGVIDLSPKDVMDVLWGGIFPAYEGRMQPTLKKGIPCIVVPGTMDFILHGPIGSVPPALLARKHVKHNPLHTHVRATYAEMKEGGAYIARHLAEGHGKRAVLVPQRGFTQTNQLGGPMYEPASDRGFIDGLTLELQKHPGHGVEVECFDLHINDPAFGDLVAKKMIDFMAISEG